MEERGVTQKGLADALQVSQAAVSKWLKGTPPSGEKLLEISQFFEVELNDLLNAGEVGNLSKANLPTLERGIEFTPQQRTLLVNCFRAIENRVLALPERERQIYLRLLGDLFVDSNR